MYGALGGERADTRPAGDGAQGGLEVVAGGDWPPVLAADTADTGRVDKGQHINIWRVPSAADVAASRRALSRPGEFSGTG